LESSRRFAPSIDPISLHSHSQWFSSRIVKIDEFPFLIAEIQEMVVGYARVDSDPNKVLMVSIAVDPDYHSKGVGSLLLKKLEEACIRRTRAEFICATISKDNSTSRVFFERNGYSLLSSDKKDFNLFRKRLNQELTN